MSGFRPGHHNRMAGGRPPRWRPRILLLVLLPTALVSVGVALASSGSAVKRGALYQGQFGGHGPSEFAPEIFTVASNGRRLTSVLVLPAECGEPPGQIATVRDVPITHGAFKVTYPAVKTLPGVFNTATLTGHFLGHGRASGQENVRSNETFTGQLCKYSVPWTASAQPHGTKQCPNHGAGLEILVDGTTCAVVDKALDNGRRGSPTPSNPAGTFSTPGWKCRVLKTGLQNHRCARSHPRKATFSFAT